MTIESTPWLDQLSALEQENALLKLRLQACETACARLQAEVMRYRSDTNQLQNEPSQNESINAGQNRDRLLEMTAIAANTLLTIEDFDHAIGAALQIVGAGLETDRVTVIEVLEPSSGLLPRWQVLYEWTSPGTPAQMANPDWIQGSFDGIEDFYNQFCQGQPVSCATDAMTEPFCSVQVQLGVKTLHAIPIFVNGHLWGVVGLDDCRIAKQRSTGELSTLKIVADCVGSAIERQRAQQTLLQAEQQRVAELAKANDALKQSLDSLASEPSLDKFLGHVLKVVAEQMDAPLTEYWYHPEPDDIAYVGLICWRGKILKPEEKPGHPGALGYPVPPKMIQQESLHHRRSHFITDDITTSEIHIQIAQESGLDAVAWYTQHGVSRFLNVPLILGNKTIGALIVFLPSNRYFTEQQIELTYALAQQVTLAIQLTRLAEEAKQTAIAREQEKSAQERVAELAQANDVLKARDHLLETTAIAANTLLSTANFDDAVNTVLQLMGEALETDRVKVLEYIDHSALYPAHFAISHEWVREGTIAQISHPSSSHISSDGAEDFIKQLFESDGFGGALKEWPEVFWKTFESVQAKAIYCVPIRLEGQIWGCLIFDDCREVKQRDLSALSVLKIAANCIGSAIQQQRSQQALIRADDAKQAAIFEERNRMAGELHDTLAQAFTGISLQIEAAMPLVGQTPSAIGNILNHLKDLAETGLTEARRSVWALYPSAIDYTDLAQLLYESLESIGRNTTTQIKVNIHGTPHPLPTLVSMNLLRISQEALTNALKHAQAQAITVDLTHADQSHTGHSILLTICDDGCGFMPPIDPKTSNGGFGLVISSPANYP